MSATFEAAIVLYALGVGSICAFAAIGARPRPPLLIPALLFVELLVVVQGFVDAVRLATGARPAELSAHLGYLVASMLVLPAAAISVRMDERRWGSAALALGCGVVAVVSIRLHQTFRAPSHA